MTNQSNTTISNAVLSGSRFTNVIGTMQPGEKHRAVVHPGGESDIRLMFEAEGLHINCSDLGYIEESSSYRVSLIVNTNLAVKTYDQRY